MPVYLDEDSRHASTHLADSPRLLEAVKEIIPTIDAIQCTEATETELSYIVGTTDLIQTTNTDEIIYALRPHRTIYARFVKNKKPSPCKIVTVVLKERPRGGYSLYTCYIGSRTPSFPGGDYLPEESKVFWSKHALVWGTQEIISDTITKQCPWS